MRNQVKVMLPRRFVPYGFCFNVASNATADNASSFILSGVGFAHGLCKVHVLILVCTRHRQEFSRGTSHILSRPFRYKSLPRVIDGPSRTFSYLRERELHLSIYDNVHLSLDFEMLCLDRFMQIVLIPSCINDHDCKCRYDCNQNIYYAICRKLHQFWPQ